ncbi:MAG: hypothetical protein D5S00_07405 [Tindallia sp. MSAO_Bac2]|nr:MAG: hypothetical protein D5S00_07405 [Tindallia sp. MSAO_Bac2]
MGEQKNRYNEQEYINDFIDELIMECKPTPPPNLDQDMAAMLETVRSVKRLRSDEVPWEWPEEKKSSPVRSKSGRPEWIKWLSAAAAIFLIVGFLQTQRQSDDAMDMVATEMAPEEAGPRMMMDTDGGQFALVAEAYQAMENYVGTMEVVRDYDGVTWEETVEITYQKPNRFVSVTRVDTGEPLTRIYDGQKLLISYRGEDAQDVTIEAMGPEALNQYLSDYHLGTMLEEIRNAPEVNILGEEKINGQQTTLYEYRYDSDQPFSRVWVDESLQLPLKQKIIHGNGDRTIRQYTSLAVDVDLDESVFAFDFEENQELHFASAEAEEAFERTEEAKDVSMAMIDDGAGLSTATVFNIIDSYYLELNLLESPYGLREFRLSEDVREQLTSRPVQPGQLVSVEFQEAEANGELEMTALNQIDQVVVEGYYQGAVDSHSVEVIIEGHPRVLSVDEEAVEGVRALSEQQASEGTEGIPVRMIIEASEITLNGKITEIIRLD